ncbi:hypothetical protein BDM02DRAFT_3107011 [Thelephora ganbajun]|uniref:Uncharacterized protein n=1 Tax=Thelephora ganbajun TaxID=370292 RepID=A0ACB6ZWQ2_THEGA|nr:hypothetical protein BDM02DRAFT_3107011 [Thelephora ganbajun]
MGYASPRPTSGSAGGRRPLSLVTNLRRRRLKQSPGPVQNLSTRYYSDASPTNAFLDCDHSGFGTTLKSLDGRIMQIKDS